MTIPHSPHFKLSDDRPNPGETPEVPAGTDRDIIFSLIDRVLPFEACLYHQVLPLSLRDNQLRLGMVDLMDVNALDYLRKVLAYFQYRLAPQVIPSDLHHQILSAYLKFKVNRNITPVEPLEPSPVFGEQTDPLTGQEDAVTTGANAGNPPKGFEGQPPVLFEQPGIVLKDEQPTISREHPIVDKPELPALAIDRNTRDTLIIESPQMEFDRSTIIQPHPSRSISPPSQVPPSLALPGNALPPLEISRLHINASSEHLLALSPKDLLEALLGRVLADGIGRLFFEHQGHQGRILWSDSGVFQSFLDCLPLDTFNGVITELKRLTSLPIDPVENVVQVEIERIYEKNRLLLRLKLMPKPQIGDQPRSEGEDATLQILRGTALRFYQQYQVSSLSRDTLTVARQLQQKVEELHRQSHSGTSINSDELAVMPEIQEVLQTVKNQLIDIERQTSPFTSPMI